MIYHPRYRDLREDNDYTQEYVALILNTTQQQYGRYEQGVREMPIVRVITLAKLYNVSVDYLLGLSNTKTPFPKQTKKTSVLN